MGAFEIVSHKIWSLSGTSLGTTIAAAGNSGAYVQPSGGGSAFGYSAIPLSRVSDVLITVIATGIAGTGTPTLTVTLSGFDDLGNLFGPLVSVSGVTASGAGGAKFAAGGRPGGYGGTSSSYVVFPEYGQVAWTVSGTTPSFSGVEICVYGQ